MRKTKLIESPRGKGEVLDQGTRIAKVNYILEVLQDVIEAETFSGVKEEEGLMYAKGSITVLDGANLLMYRDKLSLRLQDGRQIDFFIQSFAVGRDYTNPTPIKIHPIGGFY